MTRRNYDKIDDICAECAKACAEETLLDATSELYEINNMEKSEVLDTGVSCDVAIRHWTVFLPQYQLKLARFYIASWWVDFVNYVIWNKN